jgi:cyanate permease
VADSPLPDQPGLEPYLKRYRWVILTLVWLLYVAFGLGNRSVAPLVTPILADLNMSYSQMGIVLGSWQLTYIFVAIIAGTIIDKWGVRKSLFIGTVIVGLSIALRYFPTGFGSLLPVVAVFGIGGPLISIGAPKTIASWFRGKGRGTAVGIYTTGPWIGGLFALAATNSFIMPIAGYSWRLTFVYYGFLVFIIALLWLFLARDIEPTGAARGESIGRVFRRLIKIRNVRLILIMGLLSFAIMHGFTNWLPRIMESNGMSPAAAGFVASIPIIAGIAAVLLIPRLAPSQLRGRFLALLALVAAAALLISVKTLGFPMYAGLVLFGISGPSLFPIVMLILMDTPEVGEKHMGLAGGIFFCVAEIGGFAGPLIMGTLADWTGSFLTGAVFLAGLSLVIFMMTFLLRASPEPDQ